MKAPLYFLLMISLLFLFQGGCMSPQEREMTMTLNRLERQLDSLPGRESGRPFIDTLKAIPDSALSSAPLRAYHALILTQARRKERLFLNEDSLIRDAYNYYAGTSDMYHLMKAALYLSIAFQEDENNTETAYKATQAYDLANKLNEPLWIARSAEVLSQVSSQIANYEESIKFSRIAAAKYEEAGFNINSLFSHITTADNLVCLYKHKEAATLLDSVIAVAPDSLITYAAMSSAIYALLFDKQYDKAKSYLATIIDTYGLDDNPYPYLYQAWINIHENKSPVVYLQQADTLIDNLNTRHFYYQIYEKYYRSIGDYKQALNYSDSINNERYDYFTEAYRQNTSRSSLAYYINTISDYNSVLAHKTSNDAISVMAICILGILVLSYVCYRIISKRKINTAVLTSAAQHLTIENSILLNKILTFSAHNKDLKDENTALKQSRLNIFRKQWMTVNSLITGFAHPSEDSAIKHKIIMSHLEKLFLELKKPQNQAELLQQTDLYLNGTISLLKQECPFLTDDHLAFLGLNAVGFSCATICYLHDINQGNFYVKRKRLSNRITLANPPHLELFKRIFFNSQDSSKKSSNTH